MYINRTPQESLRDEIREISQEVMGEDYISMNVQGFSLKESFVEKTVETKVSLKMSSSKKITRINGQGVGVVDSVYRGYSERFSSQYKSLDGISLESFNVSVGPTVSGLTESTVNVMVEFKNSYGKVVPFRSSSQCLTRSAVMSLNGAFEYYINCELCFKKLRSLIEESRARGRFDIGEAYVSKLVKLVGVSSYEEVS